MAARTTPATPALDLDTVLKDAREKVQGTAAHLTVFQNLTFSDTGTSNPHCNV